MTIVVQHPPSRATSWRTRTAFWWICLSAVAITVLAVTPYVTASLASLTRGGSQLAASYVDRPIAMRTAFYLHISFGGLALLLSPLQFAGRLRARAPRLHRATGRTVLASIAVAGSAGLVLAPGSLAGPIGTAGFGLLALLWLTFAAAAFRAIRRGNVAGHRRWVVRAFALTYAAVTLRLWLPVLIVTQVALAAVDPQVAFDRAYQVVPFLAWVPNLILAQAYLAAGRPRRTDRPHRGPR